MNDNPHSHQPQLKRKYGNSGGFFIAYGDQEESVRWHDGLWISSCPRQPSQRQVNKALARAIKNHDLESVKAGKRERSDREIATSLPHLATDRWGSDQLAKKT
jgi:hypothetical protein